MREHQKIWDLWNLMPWEVPVGTPQTPSAHTQKVYAEGNRRLEILLAPKKKKRKIIPPDETRAGTRAKPA
jgi:hypothetical protein